MPFGIIPPGVWGHPTPGNFEKSKPLPSNQMVLKQLFSHRFSLAFEVKTAMSYLVADLKLVLFVKVNT